jgi:2-oxoglutarate dehydrogenase E2 component (dihydrolipoamide succinyltransferase)
VSQSVTQPADAYVTPLVRKLASELGVNLAQVKGTGIGGRIRREDVEALARPSAPAPSVAVASTPSAAKPPVVAVSPLRGTTVTMSRLRKVIAARMVESLQVSAQLTTVVEVDVTKIARLRDRAKGNFEANEGVKLSFLPFFAVAVCEALKQHPVLNSSVEGDQITYHAAEHLGVAVDTERGLLVPVIANAGDLNMGGIARKIADLAARTRDSKVTPGELGGGTFTLTNTGSRAGATVPQLYLVSVNGQVRQRLVGFQKVNLTPGSTRKISLTIDPRILAEWEGRGWTIAAGQYEFALGTSAETLSPPVNVRFSRRTFTP